MTTILKIDGALGAQFKADAEAAATRAELAASEAEAASLATDILPGGPCAAVATTNVTLSGVQNIDSVTGAVDQRVLLIGQSTASQNGVWLQKAGAWARPSDFNSAGEAFQGVSVFVTGGGSGGLYVLTTSGTITIDTTAQNWAQASGALKSQGIEVQMPALNAGGGASKTALEYLPPAGMINSAGGDDAVPVRFSNSITKFDNGAAPFTTYYNTVVGFGTNANDNWTAAITDSDVGMGSASLRIESGFIQPNGIAVGKAAEFHHSIFGLDGIERRPISVYAPFPAAEYVTGSLVGINASRFLLADGNGRDRVQFNLTSATNTISINGDGVSLPHPIFTFDTNNRLVMRQRNAAGNAFLPLPFINANNNLEIGNTAIYANGAPTATPLGGTVSFATFFASSGSTNQANLKVECPTVTGNFFPLIAQGSASARFNMQLYNNGAGQTVLELQTLAGASNDAILAFSNVGGGQSWTIGNDNSDGDKLKIESSYLTTGTGAALFVEFDATAGISRFAKPPRIPTYVVGSLPAAATVGAGALAYTTDLNSTTAGTVAAGGGANKGQVISDGTAWRIVAAWA